VNRFFERDVQAMGYEWGMDRGMNGVWIGV